MPDPTDALKNPVSGTPCVILLLSLWSEKKGFALRSLIHYNNWSRFMNFHIQVSNPLFLSSSSEIVSDLAEAIQVVFPIDTEDAFIVWNYTYIPLGYKYDLSVIIDDLLPMLSDLITQKEGSYRACFGSDTFNAEWNLEWYDEKLYIAAKWNNLAGNLVNMTSSSCSSLETKINIFLSE